jgi:hypothetical protein
LCMVEAVPIFLLSRVGWEGWHEAHAVRKFEKLFEA